MADVPTVNLNPHAHATMAALALEHVKTADGDTAGRIALELSCAHALTALALYLTRPVECELEGEA